MAKRNSTPGGIVGAEIAQKIKVKAALIKIRGLVPEQLALWGDDRRAIANELARCSLFQCRDNRKKRQHFDNAPLFMLGEGSVTYTGEELREREEEIFLTLAHFAREQSKDKMVVRITSADICKANNWPLDQRYYNEIFKSIQRMKAGLMTVYSRRLAKALKCQRAIDENASAEELEKLYDELMAYEAIQAGESAELDVRAGTERPLNDPRGGEIGGLMLSLISGEPSFTGAKFLSEDNIPQGNLAWEIPLDKKMVMLFARPYLTIVDFNIRKDLDATGKRLLAYFHSHKRPLPVTCRSLEKMLGLSFKNVLQLKAYINERLALLKELEAIAGFKWEKTADGKDWKVKVFRNKAETQND